MTARNKLSRKKEPMTTRSVKKIAVKAGRVASM